MPLLKMVSSLLSASAMQLTEAVTMRSSSVACFRSLGARTARCSFTADAINGFTPSGPIESPPNLDVWLHGW